MRAHLALAMLLPLLMGNNLRTAETRLKQRQWRLAAQAYREILKFKPAHYEARAGLAQSLAGMGKCTAALEEFERARDTPAWDETTALGEGDCLRRLGFLEDAEAAYLEAAALHGDYAPAWYQIAGIRLTLGDDDGFHVAVAELEDHARGYNMASLMLAMHALETGTGEFDPRRLGLQKLVDGQPRLPAHAVIALMDGIAWLDAGDPKLAEWAFLRGKKRQSNNMRLNVMHAEALRRQGYADQAQHVLDRRVIKVMDSSLADAVEVRVLVDKNDLAGARALADTLPTGDLPHALASRWYLARAEQSAEAPELRARFEAMTRAEGRTLDQLVPLGGGQ